MNYAAVAELVDLPAAGRRAKIIMELYKKYFVYALYSSKYDQLYIGHSDNMQRRFDQHNKGKVISTKPYIPYKIIYTAECASKKDAVLKKRD